MHRGCVYVTPVGSKIHPHKLPCGAMVAELSPPARGRRRTGLLVASVAVVVVLAAAAWGIRGLLGNPVRGVDASGVTTLQGSFEPFSCTTSSCSGYIQDGARSVFVELPAGCAAPGRDAALTVRARPAPDLGSGSYRALGCPA